MRLRDRSLNIFKIEFRSEKKEKKSTHGDKTNAKTREQRIKLLKKEQSAVRNQDFRARLPLL